MGKWSAIAASIVLAATPNAPLQAQTAENSPARLQLKTNQNSLETVMGVPGLDLADPMAVFRQVFSALPDVMKVYPTENYYYFSFTQNGIDIAGNLRFDRAERDAGIFHFGYFSTHRRVSAERVAQFKTITANDGATLKKIDDLNYTLTFQGRTVKVVLNDLRGVKPPARAIGPDETYLGPVFDESGMQFYFLYNRREKVFLYVLNEDAPMPDQLVRQQINPDLFIGHRTSFAYHRDPNRDRFILVGVENANALENNAYDGPFDQLPDNFIEGEALRDTILDQRPSMKGVIDRLGGYDDGDSRVVIAPYIQYSAVSDLQPVADCIAKSQGDPISYRCFDVHYLTKPSP
ncbi:MAG: hypothetical protein AAGM04_00755 [Pseudomonadota bacterium]